jgi:hypothetical protein
MDVANQVDSIVNNLVRDIETRLNARVESLITQALQSRLDSIDYESKLNFLASRKLDSMIAEMEVDQASVQQRLDAVADTVINSVQTDARQMAITHVKNRLYNDLDVNQMVREIVGVEIAQKLGTFAFPPNSIPGEAVNSKKLVISGDNVSGGIIKNFASNGIDDKSSQVQMTLLDAGVVVENKLITLGLEVKGTTVIEGDLHIVGDVPVEGKFYQTLIAHTVEATKKNLDTELFQGYSQILFDRIQDQGIELDKISIGGQPLVQGPKLNYGISDTNITRLGIVQGLETSGDTYLNQSLMVVNGRVGVNTRDPQHALSVWDQEVEIGFTKRQRDVGWMGTPREQSLILSANKNDNVVLNHDGSTTIQRLFLGGVEIGTTDQSPAGAAPRGSVMFNNNPTPGSPAGWVSLGNGAWSRFGTLG